MKKIIQFLFKSIIEEFQHEAVVEYYTRENTRHLEWAKDGIPYYLYGGKDEKGLQDAYKFTPTYLGKVKLVIKKPSAKYNKNAFSRQEEE